jgi:PAS domain S-box-containing protein
VFGGLAAKRERNNADQRLIHALNDATRRYETGAIRAGNQANAIAHSPKVQRAFIRHDRRALRRLERAYANESVRLLPGASGGASSPAAEGRADVEAHGKVVGSVLVGVLDEQLARSFANRTDQPPERLGFLVRRRLVTGAGTTAVARWPDLGKPRDLGRNRVVALRVPAHARGQAALITLKRRSEIAAAADRVRWWVSLVGFAIVAALLLIMYAMAPAIARSRLSRQQRDEAERVLAHLGDGVFVIDHHGVIRLWNQAAEAITGLRAKDVRGEKAKEAIPGWDTIAALVPVSDRPGEGEGPSSSETVPVDIDGRELWLSVVAVALDDDTVYAFRDATHDRRLEDLRTQFVATISHEIRTPLASLHGAAITLREHDLPPQTQDDLLEMIAEQSNRLAGLVEEILVAGQLDSGSLSVVADTFDPEELVRGVVTVAHSRVAEEREIEVTMPPVVPKVHGDGERTRQVLLNLIDNAIKYSPSGGQIDVRLTPVGDHLRFSVHDQGLGIPVGEQERIFDKFYRLDPDQRRGIGGTGLGLYICRELVRSMHGRIWVDSEPGKGTTFAFELPAEPLPAPV